MEVRLGVLCRFLKIANADNVRDYTSQSKRFRVGDIITDCPVFDGL